MSASIETPLESKLHYGSEGVDRLYARVWGDSIHFGIYDADDEDLEGSVIETKRRMVAIAGLQPDMRVLEVASGWGATARYLARAASARITATNIEHDHLQRASALTAMHNLQRLITHAYADYHNLPFGDGEFDVWWSQEASVHAKDKRRMFREAYRVLKPSGRIVFTDQTTDVSRCSDQDRIRLAKRHGSDDLFDAEGFMAAMRDAGFIDVLALDWSEHLSQHFANLVDRIERNYDSLVTDIPEETVVFNLSLWRFGRDIAASGGIGWHCFCGRKV